MRNKITILALWFTLSGVVIGCIAPSTISINSNTLKAMNIMKEINLSNSTEKVLVDNDDFGFLNHFNWKLNSSGYCARTTDNQLMHIIIMGTERKMKGIDHVNRIKLDNRRINLRSATATQNSVNREPKINGQYKGVTYSPEKRKRKDKNGREYFAKVTKRYRAILKHNGINYCLGSYLTPEEAAMAYDKKAFELHGEFAYINLPDKLKTK